MHHGPSDSLAILFTPWIDESALAQVVRAPPGRVLMDVWLDPTRPIDSALAWASMNTPSFQLSGQADQRRIRLTGGKPPSPVNTGLPAGSGAATLE